MDDDAEQRVPGAGIRAEVLDPSKLVSDVERDQLARWLDAALREVGACGEVRVRVVGDAEMGAAHERYGGVRGTTDVLTFDMRDDEDEVGTPAGVLDVDIWACADEARRHAATLGIPVPRELLLYCLHGVLHCLGYDDHGEGEYERMHLEEDRILEAIGVGRTFAPGGAEVAGAMKRGGGNG